MTKLGCREKQEVGRWANNRVKNSDLPFRRRERGLNRLRRATSLQKFASVANLHNHFSIERHLVDQQAYKERRSAALAEYDHASGDRPGGGIGRFDTLFGMRRADLAPAGLYNAIIRSNLISPGVRVEAAPDKRTDLMASVRPYWLAARQDAFSFTGVRDASGGAGSFAGTQFDGRIRHQVSNALRLELDAVLLAKGRFRRQAPMRRADTGRAICR